MFGDQLLATSDQHPQTKASSLHGTQGAPETSTGGPWTIVLRDKTARISLPPNSQLSLETHTCSLRQLDAMTHRLWSARCFSFSLQLADWNTKDLTHTDDTFSVTSCTNVPRLIEK